MSVNQVMAFFVALGGGAIATMFGKALMQDVRQMKQPEDITAPGYTKEGAMWKKSMQMWWLILHIFGLLLSGGVTVWGVGKMFGFFEGVKKEGLHN